MRLWSISPSYLDSKGLVAVWREGLLAQNVLLNKTKGYKNHPQLDRFKKSNTPLSALSYYLTEIYNEAKKRSYKFNYEKIWHPEEGCICFNPISVTKGQLEYEFEHLSRKLCSRDHTKAYIKEMNTKWKRQNIKSHPLFTIIDGDIEEWEKVK
jgi:hypothetical protein